MKSWYYTSYAVYFSFSLKIFAITIIKKKLGEYFMSNFPIMQPCAWDNMHINSIFWQCIQIFAMTWFVNMININVLFAFNFTFFCKYPKLHPVFKNCYKILFSSNPKVFSFRKFLQNNFYKIQVIKIVFASICVRNWKQTFSRKIFTLFTTSAVHIK